ncbi:MAG: MmcQ/YjbR family DNA-binding protein [Porphyromonas sp.]|nr:MmcQ/YjbR family DNA-binding protein [Porphyromonas sp.]
MALDIEKLRDFALSLPHVTEDLPFDPEVIVFRILDKIFMLLPLDSEDGTCFNVKCDPEIAENLRMHYNAVIPGYHMNKRHWNTIYVNKDMNDAQVLEQIRASYELVFSKIPKRLRENL